ncbi:hypothetical protein SK128_006354 [Halocaridina rubra]|uniref:C2H2-type domain-containing protein n=1 Tax=Halocaridina rubra TaxID=373956 RepID=A0AAN9A5K3_HALRR
MKTRRKYNETGEEKTEENITEHRPENSSLSSPRTHSPNKSAHMGIATCAPPDSMSLLNMLAEVASVTLHTDPSVTDGNFIEPTKVSIVRDGNFDQATKVPIMPDANFSQRAKEPSLTEPELSQRPEYPIVSDQVSIDLPQMETTFLQKSKVNPVSRKPSECEVLTLDQIAGMTDNLLVKLFAEFESNEMWKRFTYTCRMLPAACNKYFQSFGSEHKARTGMKMHLHGHLKNLLEINSSEESRQRYTLESIPARKRRLTDQESTGGKRRGVSTSSRSSKSSSILKVPNLDVNMKPKKVVVEAVKDQMYDGNSESSSVLLRVEGPSPDVKPKRKLENPKEGKNRHKRIKNVDSNAVSLPSDDLNNNNEMKSDIQDVVERILTPPMQEIVSHDHGYLKASSSLKNDSVYSKDINSGGELVYKDPPSSPNNKSLQTQVSAGEGSSSVGGCVNFCVKESHVDDQNTLLHQHMNQEVEGGIMAQDSGSDATPLPVVGCEVEFTPDQQYKLIQAAEVPVVYDRNDPSTNVQTVSRFIERDEYKVRKKPKGRAKFIGQSKAEKEMALKLITEIRSQPVMTLDTLECKICHPPRIFTALSTLLSHYRSHAGIRPYECRICEAVFTRQHSLNYHMLIHTNQTRFTCVDCGRKFRHPSHFKEHRRRHTGESPYECSDCLMRFKTRNTYKRHLRTRHEKLLTTQGNIINLSQEEADRMKKTQGRKPRRPRQPLQIISPETAAQMEEEQIWTDFEEGDREDEDEDEEETDETSPLDLTKKVQHAAFLDSQISPHAFLKNFGANQRANDKTGLVMRPKKMNIGKNGFISNLGIVSISKLEDSEEVKVKKEETEEEVITDIVADDLRSYVFHSSSPSSAVPAANVKSTWNTVNIDLNSLTKKNFMPENEVHMDNSASVNVPAINEIPDQASSVLSAESPGIVGDSINPEEVITLCAGLDTAGKDIIFSPLLEGQTPNLGGKPDWYTVKKPLKCYGRPFGNAIEPSNGNISAVALNTHCADSPEQGMYFYVQDFDGRLAKALQTSNSFVNKSKLLPANDTPSLKENVKKDDVCIVSNKIPSTLGNTVNAENRYARDHVKVQIIKPSSTSSRASNKPVKALTQRNVALSSVTDKVVINKQVVNNVVLKKNIVKNGSVVKCEERDSSVPLRSHLPVVSVVPVTKPLQPKPVIVTSVAPVTSHKQPVTPILYSKVVKSPSVIVTSVASVTNGPIVSSPVSFTNAVNSTSLLGIPCHVQTRETCPKQTSKSEQSSKLAYDGVKLYPHQMKNIVREDALNSNVVEMCNKEEKNELNCLMCNEVDSLVTISEEILLNDVEIIDSVDGETVVEESVTGIVGKDGIVKLEGDFDCKGQFILPTGTLLIPFSRSNEKENDSNLAEANVQSQTEYVGHLIQNQYYETKIA